MTPYLNDTILSRTISCVYKYDILYAGTIHKRRQLDFHSFWPLPPPVAIGKPSHQEVFPSLPINGDIVCEWFLSKFGSVCKFFYKFLQIQTFLWLLLLAQNLFLRLGTKYDNCRSFSVLARFQVYSRNIIWTLQNNVPSGLDFPRWLFNVVCNFEISDRLCLGTIVAKQSCQICFKDDKNQGRGKVLQSGWAR